MYLTTTEELIVELIEQDGIDPTDDIGSFALPDGHPNAARLTRIERGPSVGKLRVLFPWLLASIFPGS